MQSGFLPDKSRPKALPRDGLFVLRRGASQNTKAFIDAGPKTQSGAARLSADRSSGQIKTRYRASMKTELTRAKKHKVEQPA